MSKEHVMSLFVVRVTDVTSGAVPCLPNLGWLIPMALDDCVVRMTVEERSA